MRSWTCWTGLYSRTIQPNRMGCIPALILTSSKVGLYATRPPENVIKKIFMTIRFLDEATVQPGFVYRATVTTSPRWQDELERGKKQLRTTRPTSVSG